MAFIQLNYKTFEEGSTSYNTDALLFQPRGLYRCHLRSVRQQEGSPPTQQAAAELHSTLVKEVSCLEESRRAFCLPRVRRQTLISLWLWVILTKRILVHTQPSSVRKETSNASWTNLQKNHVNLQNLLKDMRGPWQCYSNGFTEGKYKVFEDISLAPLTLSLISLLF